MIRLHLALANRLRRVTRGDACAAGEFGDRGFMLVYVLMITTVITVLVGSTLVTSSGSVIPAQQAAYNQASNQAAIAGLQAFLAYADQQCKDTNSTIAQCVLPSTDSGKVVFAQDGSYTATYRWQAQKGAQYFRVTSDGVITRGGLSAKKRLIADVAGGSSTNPLDSGYVTQFETQAPDVAQALFPNRTISVSSQALGAAGLPNTGSAVTWQQAPAGTTAGNVNVCNSLFGGPSGRVNNPPPNAPNPYVDWAASGSIGSANYTDFEPCQVSLGTGTQFLGPDASQTALGLGQVRSADAFLISNSYPGGTGPKLGQPTYTQYQYDPTTDGTCGVSGQNYRTFNLLCAGYSVDIGGTPAAGSYIPTHVAQLPAWPTDPPVVNSGGSASGANGACWYNGPTRIVLKNDGSAVVTSPQTTSVIGQSDVACYGGASPNPTTGLVGVTVTNIASASHGVIYTQNNGSAPASPSAPVTSTGWPAVDTRTAGASGTNSVFYETVPPTSTTTTAYTTTAADKPYTPVLGDNPSTQTDAAWTPQWTSDTSGTTCSTSTAATDLRFYRCYASSGSYDATAYVDLKSAVKSALASNPSSYATASAFNGLINGRISLANSSDAGNANPTNLTNASHRWQVSTAQDSTPTDGCTPSATTNVAGYPQTSPGAVSAPLQSDPLFQNSKGDQTTAKTTQTQCFTATVTLQVGTCSVLNAAGLLCIGSPVWGNGTAVVGAGLSIPQFKVTETVTTVTTTVTTTQASSTFPQFGAAGQPWNSDVTYYAKGMSTPGPGDLYIEGTPSSTLALVAQNDVIVTNTLAPANTTANALEVVARDNIRIYHPVGCASTDTTAIAATTAGFCPNDITGLYSGTLTGTGVQYRNDNVYTNLTGSLSNLQINAALFALGNATVSCPKPASGGGFCGGEITADNYNRGPNLGTLTITGGMYMAHHGPLGQEWPVPDTTGVTSRPYSGYHLTEKFQSLSAAIQAISPVAKVIPLTTTSSSLWRIVSVSSAAAP